MACFLIHALSKVSENVLFLSLPLFFFICLSFFPLNYFLFLSSIFDIVLFYLTFAPLSLFPFQKNTNLSSLLPSPSLFHPLPSLSSPPFSIMCLYVCLSPVTKLTSTRYVLQITNKHMAQTLVLASAWIFISNSNPNSRLNFKRIRTVLKENVWTE